LAGCSAAVREKQLDAKPAPRTAIFYPYVTGLGKHARATKRAEFTASGGHATELRETRQPGRAE